MMRNLLEIYEVTPVNEIFRRFSRNPNPFKMARSVKDTAVAFYYTVRSAELKINGDKKLSDAYLSRANETLDTWEWLGFKRNKPEENQ
jgi:hypothetical protein